MNANTVASFLDNYLQNQLKIFNTGKKGIYPVMDYMELWNIKLTKSLSVSVSEQREE